MISVGIVDDQPLVRAGFALLVGAQEDMEVAFEAGDGHQALATMEKLTTAGAAVDVVLMDVQMPHMDGIEATEKILSRWAGVKIIMLTTFDAYDFIDGALRAGAVGFILKDSQPAELTAAIRAVAAGQSSMSASVAMQLLNGAPDTDARHHPHTPVSEPVVASHRPAPSGGAPSGVHAGAAGIATPSGDALTPREYDILALMAQGLSNEEIAACEYVSMATVKTHVRHILRKLEARDRVHAVLFALRNGIGRGTGD
ncbi:DNA-binding response regulator [Corynebacterium sp. 13CS0277]|uniref:response regulator n=1 Tax=Corynebacterium sp. 13CS0277 TaxID=2071994 RepID=UPI000D031947|nr:response regulator transcription factor [Corynebacterium sp. 13CS0277]PRQ12592.1 DNA-binding response regulator [Corynebacterium sp. 13CS0277]